MQLLAESSTELGFSGLGLIPGAVEEIGEPRWHIGWNSLEVVEDQPLLQASDGEVMYFNHSYSFQGPQEFVAGQPCTRSEPLVAAIQRGSVWGLQFHPEEPSAWAKLLDQLIRMEVTLMLRKRLLGAVVVRQGWAVQSFGYQRWLPLGKVECLVENLDRWN